MRKNLIKLYYISKTFVGYLVTTVRCKIYTAKRSLWECYLRAEPFCGRAHHKIMGLDSVKIIKDYFISYHKKLRYFTTSDNILIISKIFIIATIHFF